VAASPPQRVAHVLDGGAVVEGEAVERAGHAVEHVQRLHHARPAAVVVHGVGRHEDHPPRVQPVRALLAAAVHLRHQCACTLYVSVKRGTHGDEHNQSSLSPLENYYLAVLKALQGPHGQVPQGIQMDDVVCHHSKRGGISFTNLKQVTLSSSELW
jgi:hypothetical protein